MVDRDAWLEVAHNVLAHPLRTTLTGVSVALGIFILVVMQGLGYGLQHGVEGQFADDAVNEYGWKVVEHKSLTEATKATVQCD